MTFALLGNVSADFISWNTVVPKTWAAYPNPDPSYNDWGPSIIPGSPGGVPAQARILTFAAAGTPAPSPHASPPFFLGFTNELLDIGSASFALCSGPAPAVDTIGYVVDPQALTVLKSWNMGDGDGVVSWVPLATGTYYYVVMEVFAAGTYRFTTTLYSGQTTFVTADTLLADVTEAIFPLGGTAQLNMYAGAVPGPFTLDIDWDDGTTESHTFDHSGLQPFSSTKTLLADDFFFDQYLPGLTHTPTPYYTHVYTVPGLYTLAPTVTDSMALVRPNDMPVAAVGPPTCSITADPLLVRLPGGAALTITGHSDAWDAMHTRSAGANPDGYNPTHMGACDGTAHTGWTLTHSAGHVDGPDEFSDLTTQGAGPPPDNPDPFGPIPSSAWFPKDSTNAALAAAGTRVRLTVTVYDCFTSWSQQASASVDVTFGQPRLRQSPRDDRPRRQGRRSSSRSAQASLRQGHRNSYR